MSSTRRVSGVGVECIQECRRCEPFLRRVSTLGFDSTVQRWLTYNFHAAVFRRHRHFGGSLHRSRLNRKKPMVSLCRSVVGGRTGVYTHNPQTSVQFCEIRGWSCCCLCQVLAGACAGVKLTFSAFAHSEGRAHRRAPVRFRVWVRNCVAVRSNLFEMDRGAMERVGLCSCSAGHFLVDCGAFD